MTNNRPINSETFRANVEDEALNKFLKGKSLINIVAITSSFVAHKDAVQSPRDVERIAFGGTARVSGGRPEDNVSVTYSYLRVFYYE